MTNTDATAQIIRELGKLGTASRELNKEVRDSHTAIGVVATEVKHLSHRMKVIEKWQDDKDDKAEITGEQSFAAVTIKYSKLKQLLEQERRDRQEQIVQEAADRRARWVGWIGKAALLVVGSSLAVAVPAIASAIASAIAL